MLQKHTSCLWFLKVIEQSQMHNKSAQFIQNYNSYTMSKVWVHSYKNQTTFHVDGHLFARPIVHTIQKVKKVCKSGLISPIQSHNVCHLVCIVYSSPKHPHLILIYYFLPQSLYSCIIWHWAIKKLTILQTKTCL